MHLYDAKFEREKVRFEKSLNKYHEMLKQEFTGKKTEVNDLKNVIQSYEKRYFFFKYF